MNKTLDEINNEIKSIINEAKFISNKVRNRIIKILGEEFDIDLPLDNYENIDVSITKDGNIIMRDEEYKRDSKLSIKEINSRYNNFIEKANTILKKKEINYQTMNDKKNIVNLLVTLLFGIIYLAAIIYLVRCFIYGRFISCIWGLLILSTYFAPPLKERFNQSIDYIKRKFKK